MGLRVVIPDGTQNVVRVNLFPAGHIPLKFYCVLWELSEVVYVCVLNGGLFSEWFFLANSTLQQIGKSSD